MASNLRRGRASSALKWDSNSTKQPASGRKPLADPTSVSQVLVMVGLHVCRRVVLVQPSVKVPVYLGVLLFGSIVCDFFPIPRSYLSRKDNVFNAYFVKLAWGWTLSTVGLFIALSSWVYCCGDRALVRRHLSRLVVGTAVWFFTTNFFVVFESYTGHCSSDKYATRQLCIRNGYRWLGFDISGHAFLLIYCNLLIMEEAKSLCGWERIGEMIRNEKFDDDSPLRDVAEHRLVVLRESYPRLTPYVRLIFVAMTLLSVLWDVMLVCTVVYFHTMVQKALGGVIAIVLWFLTYRVWYTSALSPGLPGKGLFRYGDIARKSWKASGSKS
ncbi:unnamed protein product [Ixodes hexagonus]